jgi:hypothetical protein
MWGFNQWDTVRDRRRGQRRIATKLDFIQSRGVTEGVGEALKERARNLDEVVVFMGQ